MARPPLLLPTLFLTATFLGALAADDETPDKRPASDSTSATTAARENADKTDGDSADSDDDNPDLKKQLYSGQVVLLADAFRRRRIKAYPEEHKGQVVLETPAGELIPVVSDWRGRAFYQDERLRNRNVDLVGYRRDGSPYLHVLMIFTYNEAGQREYMDYWCDICSIPMYEIKPCDCCQAPIRLRFQPQKLPEYLDKKSNENSKADAAKTQASDNAAKKQ